MSGDDKQTTTQSQESQTNPWAPAAGALKDVIGRYTGIGTGPTSAQSKALTDLQASAGNVPNMGGDAAGAVARLFDSSTTPQVGMLQTGFDNLQKNLGGTASGAELNPYGTPGFSDALDTMTKNITTATKGVYAGSGRDPSGAGSFAKSLGLGLMQGTAPIIQSQYNMNKTNQMNAAKSLYDASGGTAGAITGQQQVPLTNAAQAIGLIPNVSGAYTNPAATALNAANTSYALPYQNLGMLTQPLMGIGGMGGTSSGTSTGTTTQPQNLMSNIIGGVSGGIGLMSALSDERAKDDIKEVGELHDGQKVYSYRYKGEPRTQIGLIAQEVEDFEPEAVDRIPNVGLLAVNYDLATRRAARMAPQRRAA